MEDPLSLREIAFRRCDKEPTECITDEDVAWELDSLVAAAEAGDLSVWYNDKCNMDFSSSFIVSREISDKVFAKREDYIHYYINVHEPSIKDFLKRQCTSDKDEKKLIGLWESKNEDPFSFWPETSEGNINIDKIFTHSPDFRSVVLHGEKYTLTSRQAEIVEILYHAARNGTPDVSKDFILESIGSSSSRFRDAFQNTDLIGTLILSDRGLCRLNI